jgi:hypothetical protein
MPEAAGQVLDERLPFFVAYFRAPSDHLVQLALPAKACEPLLAKQIRLMAPQTLCPDNLHTLPWRQIKRELSRQRKFETHHPGKCES